MNRNSIIYLLLIPYLKQSLRFDTRPVLQPELDNVSSPLVQTTLLRKHRPVNRTPE